MTVIEYLLEAVRVTVAGAWWVDGKINILRIFRQEVFGVLAVMKSAGMRKQQLLIEDECACCKLDVCSNSSSLPHKQETAHSCAALMADTQTHPDTGYLHVHAPTARRASYSFILHSSEGQASVRTLLKHHLH